MEALFGNGTRRRKSSARSGACKPGSDTGYEHFAVLYRTNAQSRSIEDALRRGGVPYRIIGGLSFYQRKEVKDILAYLRLLVNPGDLASLRRIVQLSRARYRGQDARTARCLCGGAPRYGLGGDRAG